MNLTDRARRDLDRYLEEVRATLRGRAGVDADDVVAGLLEHVEAALSRRHAVPGTAEDLADILERLGSPAQWGDSDAPSGSDLGGGPAELPGRTDPRSTHQENPWPDIVPLILTGAGGALVLGETTVPLGWALIAVGAVAARLVLGRPGRDVQRQNMTGALVLVLWHVAATAAAIALLLLPGILVWAQAQIGGALEPFLLEHTLPPGASAPATPGSRPGGFWPLVALLAGIASGGWWIVLGIVGRAASNRARGALAPASYLASDRVLRSILLAGGLSLTLSLLLLLWVR